MSDKKKAPSKDRPALPPSTDKKSKTGGGITHTTETKPVIKKRAP